jgi:hypothetical protein
MNHSLMRSLRALAATFLAALAACAVDVDIAGGVDGFKCTSDADCVPGFLCSNIGQPEGTVGRCVDATTGIEPECVDLDQDGAYVGSGCQPGQPYDCDDTTNTVGPNAVEVCDGIDNDCDNAVDEELPEQPCPLQIGMCAGASRACVDGAYADCAEAGLYGEDFERTEMSCDGIDNDCDGTIDETCDCIPGEDAASECGTNTGTCTRGVQYCNDDGTLSACVRAVAGRLCDNGTACTTDADCASGPCGPELCETNDDCGEDGLCVDEWLDSREDLFDDCLPGSETGCRRSVCRYLEDSIDCDDNDDCLEDESCVLGSCRRHVVSAVAETCNGLDDDCNGAIDDDFRRTEICGPCPFNMAFITVRTPSGQDDFACVDWYEASRPDATGTSVGTLEHYTLPRPGVLPWTGITPEFAESICLGEPIRELVGASGRNPIAARFLCRDFEWEQACGGKSGTAAEASYPYVLPGDDDVYVAGNCIDSAYNLDSPTTTGSTDDCCRDHAVSGEGDPVPVCDMSGNVAELVMRLGTPAVAGGSYLDSDPDVLSCSRDHFQDVPADVEERDDIGFRCCATRLR